MSKGYVAPRTPGANLVAACQNKEFNGCYIYVEGNSDVCFWKNFCSKTDTKIVACNGWTEVIDSVSMAKQKGKLSIGIVDRDFYDYIREAKKEVRPFTETVTQCHSVAVLRRSQWPCVEVHIMGIDKTFLHHCMDT